mgnify:CR=1 FL=1
MAPNMIECLSVTTIDLLLATSRSLMTLVRPRALSPHDVLSCSTPTRLPNSHDYILTS